MTVVVNLAAADGATSSIVIPNPVVALPADAVNVRNKGAVGNGVNDDTAAIQAALNAALSTSSHTVYVPAGVYMISNWLVYGNNIRIIGDDKLTSIIRNTTTRSDTLMLRPSGIGIHDVFFNKIQFDQRSDFYDASADDPNSPCCDVSATTNATFDNCAWHNARAVAVWCDVLTPNVTTNLTVKNCHIFEASGDGISTFGSLNGCHFTNNIIEHCQDDAIAVQDRMGGGFPTGCVITGNTIRDCSTQSSFGSTANGIDLFGADHCTVDSNNIQRVFSNCIRAGGGATRRGTNYTVTNNTCIGAGTNNPGTATPAWGVSVLEADTVFVNNNTCSANLFGNFNMTDSTGVTGSRP